MPKPRAALYARFSSDRQNERSIDDQLALCRRRAADLGAVVVAEHTDYALPGSHLMNRPGVLALMRDAEAGRCDLVIAEALDRLSRDQEDTAALYKRLTYWNVGIETVSEGSVNELHVGLRGTMNALYLKDLADKVRRGQRGQVERGFSAGGRSYGYDVVRALGPDGEPIRGRRTINEAEANVVRRIFREYLAGDSPRAIAKRLNAEGIAGPRGGRWNASTINGSRQRQNGILHNPLYTGRLAWGRLRMVKDPDTGRRLSRRRPDSERVETRLEDLRIISDADFDRAQAQKAARGQQRPHQVRRPRRLLSGLIECGQCGGAYTIKSGDQLACSAHRESGTCDNGRTIRASVLEERVVTGLREKMLAPDVVADAMRAYRARREATAAARKRAAAAQARELADMGPRIARIVNAIADGTDTPAMHQALIALEQRKAELEAEIALDGASGAEVVDLHPEGLDTFRARVSALSAALNASPEIRRDAARILRHLIDRVVIHPLEGRGQYRIVVHGQLAGILALSRGEDPEAAANTVSMVAEEGFEPPTQGL